MSGHVFLLDRDDRGLLDRLRWVAECYASGMVPTIKVAARVLEDAEEAREMVRAWDAAERRAQPPVPDFVEPWEGVEILEVDE